MYVFGCFAVVKFALFAASRERIRTISTRPTFSNNSSALSMECSFGRFSTTTTRNNIQTNTTSTPLAWARSISSTKSKPTRQNHPFPCIGNPNMHENCRVATY
ncbi:hypothetical protein M758_4G000400 [Ceratodon purpureus]|uniref:Uncharacterized protein n=1 Tax=Ceratodon purpureus TaxID=3225 RepID=A0A8T0I3R6_CERPU|nr:hypothetical protein KC19_4G000600 [Ceratodon purpureus]KAG0617583.1 hypothetical protein M758_4G000400 [Ceratodon purpureus]